MNSRTVTLMIAILSAGMAIAVSYAGLDVKTPDPDSQVLVDGNTHFALDLYAQLREQDGNLFVSPLSISSALAMTYAGARGNTATEMAAVLHFQLEPERLHPAFAALLAGLDAPKEQPGYQLHIANALWLQQGYKFLPEFLEIGQTHYSAGLELLDFLNAVEKARQTINTWVEKQTAGKIVELIPRDILGRTTKLVLTNAIYFKGRWAVRFDQEDTRDEPFTLGNKQRIDVPMMHQSAEFGYCDQPGLQLLDLPYAGQALSMVVLLPKEPDGLARLEKSLNARTLAGWLTKLGKKKVRVSLPRFTMTSEFRLDQNLHSLGMRAAFDPSKADFSGMDGTHELYLGAVLHKAFVDVGEEGTEAAGATAVVMKLRGSPQRPATFQADHPFLFLIRDTRTGSVLFIGRVLNPKS